MSEKENQNADKSVFMDLVQRTYSPTSEGLQNPSEAVMYKTSRELQYTGRGSCEGTVAELSMAMVESFMLVVASSSLARSILQCST